MAQASFGYFGMGVETTHGTEVAPTKFLPVKDVDFPIETDFIEIREIRGSRQAYSNFDGPVRPSVNFTSSFYSSGATGVLLRGLFGTVTTAAASTSTIAFTHTFGDAISLPSLSFERSDGAASGQGILIERVAGCKVESIGFSCAYGEDVEMTVSAQGLKFPSAPGTKPGTIAYPAANPFIFTGATVSIDGTANNYFKSIDFEFTNTLERQESLRGTREAFKIFEGGLSCTLSGTLIFDDLVLYNKLKNSENLTVTAAFQSDLADAAPTPDVFHSARFHWPKVKVSSIGLPMTAGEVMEADVEFQVSYDFVTKKIADVSITNLDPANTYNT